MSIQQSPFNSQSSDWLHSVMGFRKSRCHASNRTNCLQCSLSSASQTGFPMGLGFTSRRSMTLHFIIFNKQYFSRKETCRFVLVPPLPNTVLNICSFCLNYFSRPKICLVRQTVMTGQDIRWIKYDLSVAKQ